MGKLQNTVNRMTSDELIGECLPNRPIIELCGDSRIYIERHIGIYEYNDVQIHIGVCFGRIVIRGSRLKLASMSNESLVITGQIQCVEIIRG